jgi:hypothetical protein
VSEAWEAAVLPLNYTRAAPFYPVPGLRRSAQQQTLLI